MCGCCSCASSPTRCTLIFILVLWLVLCCARQAFDLIGRLWIPVAFDLLQILACITGLFASGQQRFSLLVALTLACVISMAYNAIILSWYAGWLGDRSGPLLSAGLPYSHSFFLRYTPSCKSQFNLTTSRWEQSTNCIVPYYNIEGIQALIHIILALVTAVLALLLGCERRQRDQRIRRGGKVRLEGGDGSTSDTASTVSGATTSTSPGRSMPKLNESHQAPEPIYGEAEPPGNFKCFPPPPPDSINDVSSGYMNSSYEASSPPPAVSVAAPVPVFAPMPKKGILSSKRKYTENQQAPRPKSQMTTRRCDEDYSSVTTSDSFSSNRRRRASSSPKMKRQSALDATGDYSESNSSTGRQYSKMRKKSKASTYVNTPGSRPQSMAEKRLSQAAAEQLRRESLLNSTGKDDDGYLEYVRSPDRPPQPTSLITFDPKSSSSQVFKVTEHLEDAGIEDDMDFDGGGYYEAADHDDDQRSVKSDSNAYREVIDFGVKLCSGRTTSQDSVPSIRAPTLMTSGQQGMDSGHPSTSTTHSSSSDWSQAGIGIAVPSQSTRISSASGRPAVVPPLPPHNGHQSSQVPLRTEYSDVEKYSGIPLVKTASCTDYTRQHSLPYRLQYSSSSASVYDPNTLVLRPSSKVYLPTQLPSTTSVLRQRPQPPKSQSTTLDSLPRPPTALLPPTRFSAYAELSHTYFPATTTAGNAASRFSASTASYRTSSGGESLSSSSDAPKTPTTPGVLLASSTGLIV